MRPFPVITLLGLMLLGVAPAFHAAPPPAATHHGNLLQTTETWPLSRLVYAQMRIVPTGERGLGSKPDGLPPKEVYEWNGPWGRYKNFNVYVAYHEGHRLKPEQFDYVQPEVGLEGTDGENGSTWESHSEDIDLFKGASAPGDIRVQCCPIGSPPELNREYKAATLSSEKEKFAWDVYVRFRETKPEYVKPANSP